MDFLLPHAAVDDLMSAVPSDVVREVQRGCGVFAAGRRPLPEDDVRNTYVLQTGFPKASAAPTRLRARQRRMQSATAGAGCLAGLLIIQMLGQVATLGGLGLSGRSRPPFDTFSSADAAIDSCVALATSSSYGVQSDHTTTPSHREAHKTLSLGAATSANADTLETEIAGLPRGYKAIVQRLGLLERVQDGLVQLPCSKIDQADLLMDLMASAAPNRMHSGASSCKHPGGRGECSHECLTRVRETYDEAQLLFRRGRFEEARLWFQDATLRLASYSNKTQSNTGYSPHWREGNRLNREWAEVAIDTAIGAGQCCLRLEQYPDAIIESTTALLLEPGNLQALYTRGLAYERMANEARRKSAVANRVAPAGSQRASTRTRLLQQAWKDLWKAHAADPRHPLIIDALDECREEMRSEGTGRMPNMFERAMQWTKQAFPVEHAYSSPIRLRRSPLSSPHRLRALMQGKAEERQRESERGSSWTRSPCSPRSARDDAPDESAGDSVNALDQSAGYSVEPEEVELTASQDPADIGGLGRTTTDTQDGQMDASPHIASPSPWPHTMLILQDEHGAQRAEEQRSEPSSASELRRSGDVEEHTDDQQEPTDDRDPSYASAWARKIVSTSPARAALKRMTQSILAQVESLKESIYGEAEDDVRDLSSQESLERLAQPSQESFERLAQPTLATSYSKGSTEHREETRVSDVLSKGVDEEKRTQESPMEGIDRLALEQEQAMSPPHRNSPPLQFLNRLHPGVQSQSEVPDPGHDCVDEPESIMASTERGRASKAEALVDSVSQPAEDESSALNRNAGAGAPSFQAGTSPSPLQCSSPGLKEAAVAEGQGKGKNECMSTEIRGLEQSIQGLQQEIRALEQSAPTPSCEDLPLSQADLKAAASFQSAEVSVGEAGEEDAQLTPDQDAQVASDPHAAGARRSQPLVTPLRASLLAAHELRSELLENVVGGQIDTEASSPYKSWYLGSLASREDHPDTDGGHPRPNSGANGNVTKSAKRTFRRPVRTPSQHKLPDLEVALPPQTPPSLHIQSNARAVENEISFDTPTLPVPADKDFGYHGEVLSQIQDGQKMAVMSGSARVGAGVQIQVAEAALGEQASGAAATAAEEQRRAEGEAARKVKEEKKLKEAEEEAARKEEEERKAKEEETAAAAAKAAEEERKAEEEAARKEEQERKAMEEETAAAAAKAVVEQRKAEEEARKEEEERKAMEADAAAAAKAARKVEEERKAMEAEAAAAASSKAAEEKRKAEEEAARKEEEERKAKEADAVAARTSKLRNDQALVLTRVAAGIGRDGANGMEVSEPAAEEWECVVVESESLLPDAEGGSPHEAHKPQSRLHPNLRDESEVGYEYPDTSRRVDTPSDLDPDALNNSFLDLKKLLVQQPLAWMGTASAALHDFRERLPELLTRSHLMRPRKLRPEVRELFMRCHGAPGAGAQT